MVAARKNPVGDIIQWNIEPGKLGIIRVEHVDVDDARNGLAPGHVLRLAPRLKGVYQFSTTWFKHTSKGWVPANGSRHVDHKGIAKVESEGQCDFTRGKFEPWKSAKFKLTGRALKHCKKLFYWVRSELKEHGKFPPPATGKIRYAGKTSSKAKGAKRGAKSVKRGAKASTKRPARAKATIKRGAAKRAPKRARRNPTGRRRAEICCLP